MSLLHQSSGVYPFDLITLTGYTAVRDASRLKRRALYVTHCPHSVSAPCDHQIAMIYLLESQAKAILRNLQDMQQPGRILLKKLHILIRNGHHLPGSPLSQLHAGGDRCWSV